MPSLLLLLDGCSIWNESLLPRLPKNFIRLRTVQEEGLLTLEEEALLYWPRFVFWVKRGKTAVEKAALNPFQASEAQVQGFLRFVVDGAGPLKEVFAVSRTKKSFKIKFLIPSPLFIFFPGAADRVAPLAVVSRSQGSVPSSALAQEDFPNKEGEKWNHEANCLRQPKDQCGAN